MTVYSALRGTVWAIVLVVVLTVGAELFAPLKSTLAAVFGHHWIGKGVLSAALWLTVAYVGSDKPFENTVGYLRRALVCGSLVIVGFYVIHYWL